MIPTCCRSYGRVYATHDLVSRHRPRQIYTSSRRRQRFLSGSVLLAVLLLLVIIAAVVLIRVMA